MRKKLLLLSFIEGAAVMAVELCGAKLLAPIFGSSLYVWASVMGITLAALAGGYFYGGRLASSEDRAAKSLSRIISAAALLILLMPVFSHYLVPRISYLPFLPGMVLSTMLLLFSPVFFLGASSPLFIVIQTTTAGSSGRVSGTVYAVSTSGGILATFLCGFYLIPDLGLNKCLMICGGLLFLVNALVFSKVGGGFLFVLIAAAYLNYQLSSSKPLSLLTSDSILGHLEVADVKGDEGPVRLLKINDIVQTEMDLKTRRSVSPYIHLIDSLLKKKQEGGAALVLGLGGGLTANLLVEKNYSTVGVEFDERIITAARDLFFLNEQVQTCHADARIFLNHCADRFDIILADLFKAEEQPSHVLTAESLIRLKDNLHQDGLLLVSWHGYLSGSRGRGTVILYNTLRGAGYHVKLCAMRAEENTRNLIFVASPEPLPVLPYELDEIIGENALVNTDDRPVLEKYNAEANKAWRTQYLRYYQGKNF